MRRKKAIKKTRKITRKPKRQIDWAAYHRKRNREYRSAWYAKLRTYVFARDGYTCALTGQKGGHLQMHHIKSYSRHPELRYDTRNLVTLSRAAHEKVSGQEEKYEEYLWKVVQARERKVGKQDGETNS